MNTSLLAKTCVATLAAVAVFVSPQAALFAHAGSANTLTFAAAVPEGCKPYSGPHARSGIWCELHIGRLNSGVGKAWGPFYTLRADSPAGYKLAWSEGHVFSGDHQCGVKDQADVAPSPRNGEGQLEGFSHWARCFITERDDSHVTMVFRIQGWEGGTFVDFQNNQPLKIDFKRDASKEGGRAEIWAVFVPAAAS